MENKTFCGAIDGMYANPEYSGFLRAEDVRYKPLDEALKAVKATPEWKAKEEAWDAVTETPEYKAWKEKEEALGTTPEFEDYLEAKVSCWTANEILKYQKYRRKDFGFRWY